MGVQARPLVSPMDQLQKIFTDFEPRLCEREALAAEIDRAHRSGDITKAPAAWRAKQDQLIELNDVMIDFQLRAGKITKPVGNDSAETAALRKFQAGLKTCEQRGVTQPAATPAKPASPAATPAPAPTPASAPAPAKPAAK